MDRALTIMLYVVVYVVIAVICSTFNVGVILVSV